MPQGGLQRVQGQLAVNQVAHGIGQTVPRVGRAAEATTLAADDAIFPHQTGDALAPDPPLLIPKVPVDPRAAVGPAALPVRGAHLGPQLPVGGLPLRRPALLECVVPAPRNLEDTAENGERVERRPRCARVASSPTDWSSRRWSMLPRLHALRIEPYPRLRISQPHESRMSAFSSRTCPRTASQFTFQRGLVVPSLPEYHNCVDRPSSRLSGEVSDAP